MVKIMKPWNKYTLKIFLNKLFLKKFNERGQSIVEFVLLLAAISFLSYFFIAVMNRNIGRYWEYSVNLIVNDKPGKKTLSLP
jgi:hypothetical protein